MSSIVSPASAAETASSPPQQPSSYGKDIPIPIVAASLTVGGGLLIAYLVNRWNRTREREGRFAAAASKFREAFAPDIAYLENRSWSGTDLGEYLREAHNTRQASAVALFRQALPTEAAIRFADDWNRYRYGEYEDGSAASPETAELDHETFLMLCYSVPGVSWENHIRSTGTAKALTRIKTLLEYARG